MSKEKPIRVTPSTGNVFRDLGFSKEESEHLLVRADLLIQVQKTITSRRLIQAEAAKVLRVTQPRLSDLLRGRIDLFSTDALIDMLARLGVGVRWWSSRRGRGRLHDMSAANSGTDLIQLLREKYEADLKVRLYTTEAYLACIRGIFSSAIDACHANVAMKMADSFSSSSLMRSGKSALVWRVRSS